jgi:hypothetical protein
MNKKLFTLSGDASKAGLEFVKDGIVVKAAKKIVLHK